MSDGCVSVLSLLAAIALGGCTATPAGDTPPAGGDAAPAGRYDVEVTRTPFGIPHVDADDYRSLGYGLGYAYAQDNFCMLAEKVLQLNGERSRHFGPDSQAAVGVGSEVSSRVSDYFYRSQFDAREIAAGHREASPKGRDLTLGYAAGVNRYLQETGVDGLQERCRGAEWVRPITERDLYLWYTAVATIASSQALMEAIVAAQPPAPDSVGPGAGSDRGGEGMQASPPGGIGSNAWAFGRDATANGRGLLLGNPHWEWGTMNQFYVAHLTVPGELDVMGATYGGMPVVVIGFNQSVAWSHTVSTGSRFVVRELKLASGSPTTYVVDGEPRQMERQEVAIEVAEEGAIRRESRTFYSTEFGPVVEMDELPWTDSTAYALTDLNLPNYRMIPQWLAFAEAQDVEAVREAAASILGIPWVNTLAADAEGGALYADYSVKPYVTDAMLEGCAGSAAAQRATRRGLLTLDGSTTACDPKTDAAAPQEGILPPELLPVLERSDYVANSNNTYWLSNPHEPLTGFPVVNGPSRTPLGFRAQAGLRTIEDRLAGRDGLQGNRFDHETVKALVFGHPAHPEHGNRNRTAEVMMDAVVSTCADGPIVTVPEIGEIDITEACAVLTRWDRRHDLTSVGAQVFREFRRAGPWTENFWATPFDPERPLETPADPDVEAPRVREAIRQALGQAVRTLAEQQIPLDRPWRDVHFHPVQDTPVPIRGGTGGILNLMTTPRTEGGYAPVVHGASYVQIVGFDDNGPVAHAVLLYGQSTVPASPFYYDQLRELWTPLEWLRLPFTPAEIDASAVDRIRLRD